MPLGVVSTAFLHAAMSGEVFVLAAEGILSRWQVPLETEEKQCMAFGLRRNCGKNTLPR